MILVTTISCKGQNSNQTEFTYGNFENEILKYEPIKKETLSKKDFDYGLMILNETKKAVKNNPNNFNVLDYFNILSSFLTLKENENNIKIAFNKFIDSEGSCQYIINFEKDIIDNPKYKIIINYYLAELSNCKSNKTEKASFDITEYCKKRNLDMQLVSLFNEIFENDRKFRIDKPVNWNKQRPLDIKNQQLIDSLFRKYKKYIGKSLVGKKYESVMWTVIQHSNLKMMERYLPTIHKAIVDKELDVVPLKMLIDRIYAIKYGYQIFGSQFGVKLCDEKKRKEIELQYGIE